MTAATPYPLGRRLDAEHDPRSRGFQAAASPVLKNVIHAHMGPALDQGDYDQQPDVQAYLATVGLAGKRDSSGCTGNAGAQARNTRPLWKSKEPILGEVDALKLYARATQLDQWSGNEWPGADDGSDGLSVAKAMKELGLISSYTHSFSLAQTLGALVLGPVMIGIPFYESMFNLNRAGFMIPGGQIAGGHEMCLVGINAQGSYVIGINSWGPKWGMRGRFKMAFTDLGRLLSEDGDATVPIR